MFNVAQSFFLDKQVVQGSPVAFLTSVDLFFRSKPPISYFSSSVKPGVLVNVCSIVDGKPDLNTIDHRTYSRVEYDDINASSAGNVITKFSFKQPIPFATDKEYAILISFDGNNSGFILWKNTANQVDVVTGSFTKVSSGRVDGNYFDLANGTEITRRNDVDLKFQVFVARFTGARSNTFIVSNEAYEFFDLTSGSVNGAFVGGEYVYQAQANLTGTVSVSSGGSNVDGTGTDFVTDISNGDLIVVGNSSVSQIRVINKVTNTTFMNVTTSFVTTAAAVNIHSFETGTIEVNSLSNTVIGTGTSFGSISVGSFITITDGTDGNTEVRNVLGVDSVNQTLTLDVTPSFSNTSAAWFVSPVAKVEKFKAYSDNIILRSSSANSSAYFLTGRILKGVDFQANAVIGNIKNMSLGGYRPSFNIQVPAGTSTKYSVNFANSSYGKDINNNIEVSNKSSNFVLNYPATLASRSNEVQNSGNLFANSKSMNSTLTFSSDNPFASPYVTETNLDFVTSEFSINNSSANEVYANGAALTRYISKVVTLEEDQVAEDLIVYLTAFKPSSTDIEVYARLLSEEDNEFITDKNWTKLELDIPSGSSVNSIDSNPRDLVELKYVIPSFNEGTKVTAGTFATALATNVITSSFSTVNTSIAVGDLVRVYNPTFPDTYFVDVVVDSNTSTFTVSQAIANSDVVGTGLSVDVVNDKSSAFLNNQNYNVVRYFSKNSAKYDGYKAFAVKIVLLAESYHLVPRVSEYRAIAVSA